MAGVFELGNDLGFALKPQAELWIGMQEFAWQDLDGDLALEARIICPIDRCHSAAPQFRFYFVDANFFRLHSDSSIPIPKGETQAFTT